jgi:hypothetical protein
MKKLVFITIFLSYCINFFAQSNPSQIFQNKEAEKNRRVNKEQTNNNFKKDTLVNDTKPTRIQIGAGGLYTSLNFFKNAQAFTYYPAYSARLYFQPNSIIQFVLDYSKVQQVNIIPTWLNVHNTYLDIDAHLLMHPNQGKTTVYFILGFSTQFWKGVYTGVDDYNYYVLHVKHNTDYKTIYYGASLGIGFEYKLVKRLEAYGEVRYRMTKTDVGFGLSDVCYGVGLKYTLFDFHPKPVYNKPGKHFKWIKGKSQSNF